MRQQPRKLRRRVGGYLPAETAHERMRFFRRAIHHRDLQAAVQQRVDDRARRAAGTDHDRRPMLVPTGCGLVEIGQKPDEIGIAADEPIAFVPNRVDRPDRLGRLLAMIDQPKCRILVRRGDIAPDISAVGKVAEKLRKRLGRNVHELVGAAETQAPQPMIVNHRRARIGHAMAHDAGLRDRRLGWFGHAASQPSRRKKARSASSGRPRMAK